MLDIIRNRELQFPLSRITAILPGATAMASGKAEKSRKKEPSLKELLQAMLLLQGWHQQLLCAALNQANKKLKPGKKSPRRSRDTD